ncbi:MAG: hypothetical protein Udaeo2_22980 [Candidatus Udaeobacter sp.]|nr:MAG: hypothetical protein Udaeo2_22980 [Candidatus Udaeobacter sp.]
MQPKLSHRMMAHAALIGLARLPLIAQSERPTLREMAIAIGNGSAGGNIESCGPTPFLADVVERADLIVEGIVRTRASYLTDDGRDIFTDYDLSIRHVLFQREMLVSSRPGVAVPVIFKSHGGQVIVDGLRLVVNVQTNHARVTLTEGDHVYLFAARDRDDGKWRVNPYDGSRSSTARLCPDDFSDVPKSAANRSVRSKIYSDAARRRHSALEQAPSIQLHASAQNDSSRGGGLLQSLLTIRCLPALMAKVLRYRTDNGTPQKGKSLASCHVVAEPPTKTSRTVTIARGLVRVLVNHQRFQ